MKKDYEEPMSFSEQLEWDMVGAMLQSAIAVIESSPTELNSIQAAKILEALRVTLERLSNSSQESRLNEEFIDYTLEHFLAVLELSPFSPSRDTINRIMRAVRTVMVEM